MQQPLVWCELNETFQNDEFKATDYTIELEQEIEQIIQAKNMRFFQPKQIPYAIFEFKPKSMLNALLNQKYEVKNNHQIITITCNPFHNCHREPTQNNYYITRPTQFINQLAKQLTNPTEGLWSIIHFYTASKAVTDIHITKGKICFKKNGKIFLTLPIGKKEQDQLIYFIKLTSHLDPSITKIPQDGAYQFNNYTIQIDGRVATLPIINGEMLSIRCFQKTEKLDTLERLGFSKRKLNEIRKTLKQPNGLILITGTTGSGKSTTLYAMLKELRKRHVITMEDPVEKVIPEIIQTDINNKQGYTMETSLKAILRHNPDVIAVGEIRDRKTAEIVLHAAYTGHLVIASLHTNSVEATLLRLLNLGCSPFLISYCLRAIISQSLEYKDNIKLNSNLLICEKPFIVNDLKKELPHFLNHHLQIE